MMQPPAQPKIYHITHLDNLPKIIDAACLWSDAKRIELGLDCNLVGMSTIKQRRLERIEVSCHPGTKVGQYVPFYYCPRSVMLYILHKGNHPEITYAQGQAPIVHLQLDLTQSRQWADDHGIRWAIAPTNAGAFYTDFYNSVADLSRVDWNAVSNRDFHDSNVKEKKQAEFLVFDSVPWALVEHVGVFDQNGVMAVQSAIAASPHHPPVRVENSWYF